MDVRGYLPTSLIEWPGKISAVVFVGGCNFRCPYCQNKDLVDPKKIKRLKEISEKSIFEDLKKRKKWLDSVVITGGEPTLQEDLSRFLKRCKRLGFLTMIETNGTRPEIMAELLNGQMVDRISMDVKGSFEDYPQITKSKVSISKIKESIQLIMDSGVDYEFRTTVVPTLHQKKDLLKIAKILRGAKKWFLNQFRPINCLDPKFEKVKPYSKKEMEEILRAVREYLPNVKLRGV